MARFFFNLFNDETTVDEEGQDLPGLEEARERAMHEGRVMAGESVLRGHLYLDDHIEVRDEAGEIVLKVTFAEAVKVRDSR